MSNLMLIKKISQMSSFLLVTNSDRVNFYIERILIASLAGLSIATFFTIADKGLIKFFSVLSLVALLIWRYGVKYEPVNPIPKPVVITALLFIISVSISALFSENRHFSFLLFKHYRFILLCGLLFSAPIDDRYRKKIILLFFASAAVAAGVGILQHFGIVQTADLNRPDGFSGNPNIYAGVLAVVCSATITILFLPDRALFRSEIECFILALVGFLTLCAIVLTQSRGVWIALFAAPVITLLLNGRRKAFVLLLLFVAVSAVFFISSNRLKQRAASIVTSIYSEDESTSLRLEYWRAALLIFKEHPILGSGLGDFEPNVVRLVAKKKIKQIPTLYTHAHNIFLQVLATRGIFGLASLLSLCTFLLKWGINLVRTHRSIGGYIICQITLLTMIAGLTDNHIEFTVFLAASTLCIGLLGPYGISDGHFPDNK